MPGAPKKVRGNRAIQARIPAGLRADFDALAKRRGMQPSSLLRELIHLAVDRAAEAAPPLQPVLPGSLEDLRRERITPRLPAYAMRLAADRAAQARTLPATWLANPVQSNVTGNPVFDSATRRELEAAARELPAAGRNINQIARALNDAHFRTERVKLERLDELDQLITRLRQAVRGVTAVSMNAWAGGS